MSPSESSGMRGQQVQCIGLDGIVSLSQSFKAHFLNPHPDTEQPESCYMLVLGLGPICSKPWNVPIWHVGLHRGQEINMLWKLLESH